MKNTLRDLGLPLNGAKARLIERYAEHLSSGPKRVMRDGEGPPSVFDGLERITRDTYILLKQVHPELSLSTPAQDYLVDRIKFLISLLLKNVSTLLQMARGRTLSSRVAQASCRVVLPHPLDDEVVSRATVAIAQWHNTRIELEDAREPQDPNGAKIRGRRVLDKDKAGLRLRPSLLNKIFHQILSQDQEDYHYSKGFTIYLTAAIEFILTQLLDHAGRVAQSDQRVRITPYHLDYAILTDSLLSILFTSPVSETFAPDVNRLNQLRYAPDAEWTAFQTRIARASLEPVHRSPRAPKASKGPKALKALEVPQASKGPKALRAPKAPKASRAAPQP